MQKVPILKLYVEWGTGLNHKNIRIATKLRILGFFAIILLLILTTVGYTLAFFNDIRNEGIRAVPIYYETRAGIHLAAIERKHKVKYLSMDEARELLKTAEFVVLRKMMRDSFFSGDLQMYYVPGGTMYEVRHKNRSFYFLNPNPSNAYIPIVIGLSLIALGLIFFIYYLIYSSIKPLEHLRKEIESFEKNGSFILKENMANDEVGEVSKAFVKVVKKLNRLQQSRKLFLRNIMHEFKTPLAKGKLIATMSDTLHTPVLQKIFDTQQALLEGLGTIESIMSEVVVFDIHTYAMVDLVESVMDELECSEKEIEVAVGNVLIQTDFYYFTLVLKNLISNAIKYKTKGKIKVTCENKMLYIYNYGAPFIKSFQEYLQPFVSSSENKLESMGLGLYVVNEVVSRMGRRLEYSYQNGIHCFCINIEKKEV